MKFRVSLDGRLSAETGDLDDQAQEALSSAMSELSSQCPQSSAMDLTNSTGDITITCVVDADSPMTAVQSASDVIRLALHTGRIGTPQWPDTNDSIWRVDFVASRAEQLVV